MLCYLIELLSNKKMVGRVLDWVLKYGPAKLTLTVKATEDPQKVRYFIVHEFMSSTQKVMRLLFLIFQLFLLYYSMLFTI